METVVKGDMGGLHRSLLCQGPVKITIYKKRKKKHLSLFNDVLVVSSNLKKKKFKIKCIIPLKNLWAVDDVIFYRGNKNYSSTTLYLFWPDGKFFATFGSKEQKDQWYYFLKRSINNAKRGMKKTFSLQIFTENIPTCDSPLFVSTTTIDKVNDIMKKLLPMIRVPHIEDYQLWFCPGHEKAPRALQGHECPHDIILTNLQNNLSRLNSKMFPAFPALPGLLVNDTYLDAQGQFILKPILMYSAKSQQQYSEKIQENVPATEKATFKNLPSQVKSQLVPKFPSIVCFKKLLPAPILDFTRNIQGNMLSSDSYENWISIPDETSVLAKSSAIQSISLKMPQPYFLLCSYLLRELPKMTTSSRIHLDMDLSSLHVAPHVLWDPTCRNSLVGSDHSENDFTRNIQGNMLSSDSYENWISIPDETSVLAKSSAIQSISLKMPQPYFLLCSYLLRELPKMTTSSRIHLDMDLSSLHVAPHVLWDLTCRNSLVGSDCSENDFTRNIQGNMLSSDSYENWISIPDETSVLAKSSAIQSISLKMPQPYFLLCSYLLRELPKMTTSSRIHLDMDLSSLHVAPHVLWDLTCRNSLVGSDCSENDFTRNIQGNMLSSDSYENWISIPDETSVLAKSSAIQSISLKMPQPYFLLCSYLLRELPKMTTSSRIHLDMVLSSLHVAPHMLWDLTCRNSLVGSDRSENDFTRNIQGNMLSSDSYENWISIPDETSVLAKSSAIQSISLKMPQPYFLLCNYLLRELPKMTTSSRIHLDMVLSSLHVAPHVLWDPTCRNSLVGSDRSENMTFRQVMIDNNVEVLEDNDYTVGSDIQDGSDDLKMSQNTAGWNIGKTSTYNVPQRNYFLQIVLVAIFMFMVCITYIYLL
uniref:rho GTPase-activating protein 20-like n=1 Tax=Arvicanthis niloticus TaxID=61156 RepID=UPI0014862CC7|nr:rho GTPase-activating protein 20-like [Arvicanthis niloticus]